MYSTPIYYAENAGFTVRLISLTEPITMIMTCLFPQSLDHSCGGAPCWRSLSSFALWSTGQGPHCITTINYVRTFLLRQRPVPINRGFRWSKWIWVCIAPIFPASGEPEYSLTHRIEAPVTLQYYTQIPGGATAVALEIPKGTICSTGPLTAGIWCCLGRWWWSPLSC